MTTEVPAAAFTCVLSYPEDPAHWTAWHPSTSVGPLSRLQRGHFANEQEAHSWAEDKGIHPDTYKVKPVPYLP